MASELRVNTLKDASGNNSVATSVIAEGTIKGWLSANATDTLSARDSYNVASLTDVGTGIFQTNFTSAFANVNHCTSTGLEIEDGGNVNYMYQMLMIDRAGETTSRVEINTGYRAANDASFSDNFDYWHQTTGDLA